MSTITQPTFETLLEYAYSKRYLVDQDATFVEFVVTFNERALLLGDQRVYDDPYMLVQTVSGSQGACFMNLGDTKDTDVEGVVGKPALEVASTVPRHVGIALLDAYYQLLNIAEGIIPSETLFFNGLGHEKSLQRAKKIIELAQIEKGVKVAMIGVISDIVKEALDKGASIKLADFGMYGAESFGLPIEKDATQFINWADVVIMTGNTLKTRTTDSLLENISKNNKRILVYAMTGSNIAPRYLRYGAHTVTCESFPYYWYANVASCMKIYRA